MELKYIWVKKFKNLKEVGFNINNSDAQRFEYNGAELTLSKNGGQSEGSFFGSNISSLTAIIGKNGSGKTNLADFIHYHLSNFDVGSYEDYGYKPIAIIVIGKVIFCHEKLNISNIEQIEKEGFSTIRYKNLPNEKLTRNQKALEELHQSSYIYYANIYYYKNAPGRLLNLTNVSTKYLLNSSLFKDGFYTHFLEGRNTGKIPATEYDAFIKSEMIRISDFVFERDYGYPFDKLPHFSFYLDFSRNNFFLRSKADHDSPNIHNKLDRIEDSIFYNSIGDPIQRSNPEKYFISKETWKINFIRLFLLNIIRASINKDANFTQNYDLIFSFIFEVAFLGDGQLPDSLIKLKIQVLKLADYADWQDRRVYYDDRVPLLLSERSYEYISFFKINAKKHYQVIKDFLSVFKEVFPNTRLGYYSLITDISAGETSMLTLFSRLYYAKKQLTRKGYVKNVKIFIDEGEVNLHPEWQRQFFSKLISFIEEEFSEYKVQLLLTSHNPFLVSDIPKNNILFLDRDAKGNCKVANFNREQTFGANIHTLLSDSFFMDKGVLGEFAKKTITRLIEYLTNEHASEYFTQSSAERLINMVGEPVIQDRLKDLFLEKFGKKESRQEKIARLLKAIEEIESEPDPEDD